MPRRCFAPSGRLRFLVDENLPAAAADALRHLGHDVVEIADSALRGASDPVIWRAAVADARILVTRDLDFPLRGDGWPPGLVLVRARTRMKVDEIASLLRNAAEHIEATSLLGCVTVVEPGRVRQRPFTALG